MREMIFPAVYQIHKAIAYSKEERSSNFTSGHNFQTGATYQRKIKMRGFQITILPGQ
jgi:hypothetical protein